MTISDILAYCQMHDLQPMEGLSLLSEAIKVATKSKDNIIPLIENGGEISFRVQTTNDEMREINMKPSIAAKISALLENRVLKKQIARSLIDLDIQNKIVRGSIVESKPNGWFVNLPNCRAFMPREFAIQQEAEQNQYAIGKTYRFSVVAASKQRNGKPKILLSRTDRNLARVIAEERFSIYGFVNVKRKPGEIQTITLRAFPQKVDCDCYRAEFPTERVNFRKLLPDGSIKLPDRRPQRSR